MSLPSRLFARLWALVPLVAIGFIAVSASMRARRVEYVSSLSGWSVADPAPSAKAPFSPRLIVPEPNDASYEWLNQTRQMLERGEARVRHVDYENAPFGLDLHAASPYRWWLGLVAWADRATSGRSVGASLERAALFADPLLHLLLVAAASLFIAWRFGGLAAALVSLAMATLFPFAGEFLAGVPDDHGLAQALAILSVLPLLAGFQSLHSGLGDAAVRGRRWFCAAGILGGIGLWVSVAVLAPVIIGTALGGLIAASAGRLDAPGTSGKVPAAAPWRAWALGGAASTLVAYGIEYFPNYLGSWQIRSIHPLYGLGWFGLGEVLTLIGAALQGVRPAKRLRAVARGVFGLAALAALPVAMRLTHNQGFLEEELPMLRLTRLQGIAVAPSVGAWVTQDGLNAPEWAAILPLVLLVPAVLLLFRRKTGAAPRALLAVALGPAAVAAGFACWHLSWWNGLDGALLAVIVAVTVSVSGSFPSRFAPWLWAGTVAAVLALGCVQVLPPAAAASQNALGESEVIGLIERDLARWLAKHADADKAVVLAPPNETNTLYYFGRLRGLATLGWENRDGIGAAIRIVSASTPEEAQELINRRGITHIIIPSWDSYLLKYAQIGMGQVEGTFLNQLHQWSLPTWLEPVAYPLPDIAGFEGQSITILEVVDEQDDATAASRMAEYFVEMDHLDFAASAAQRLRRFPANLAALVARAQVQGAQGDADGFGRTVTLLLPRLSTPADRALPWDERVALAIVLAQAQHFDSARAEARQCLAEADADKLRALPPLLLYRFQVLNKVLGLEITDPTLHRLGLDLLPPAYSSRLAQ